MHVHTIIHASGFTSIIKSYNHKLYFMVFLEFNAGQTQHQDDENHTCFQCIKKLFSSRDRNRGVTEPGTTEQTSNENTSCQQDHKIEFEITDSQSHSSKSTPPSTGTSGHSADQGTNGNHIIFIARVSNPLTK